MTRAPRQDDTFTRYVSPFLEQLTARALALSGRNGDADDLVQDTIERALRNKAALHTGTHPSHWLFRVMFNLFADRWRKESKLVSRCPFALEQVAEGPEYEPCPWEMLAEKDVHEAMGQLAPVHRAVLKLSIVDRRSYREIGEILGIPVATVGTRLHRARQKLKAILASSSAPVPIARVRARPPRRSRAGNALRVATGGG